MEDGYMGKITWCSDFCVGVAEIDAQHEHLVSMVNELFRAYMQGREKEVLSDIITGLSDYTAYHFSTEERLMDEHAYPATAEHRLEHREFIDRSIDFLLAYTSSNQEQDLAPVVLDYLEDWLLKHIRGTDVELGKFLRDKGVR
jgi:hemerythrin-like metal-binding protein